MAGLKTRAEFLRVANKGVRASSSGVAVQWLPEERPSRVGFTATKKIGNAVVRNRAKRRLRALWAEAIGSDWVRPGDYVLIARRSTAHRSYAKLRADLRSAISRATELSQKHHKG